MTADEEINARAAKLTVELDGEIAQEKLFATGGYRIAMALVLTGLLSSFIAGIGGLVHLWKPDVTAVLAFIPGSTTIFLSTLKFEGKSDWHYRKLYALQSLRERLLYQGPIPLTADFVARIASEKTALIKKMNEEWEAHLGLGRKGHH